MDDEQLIKELFQQERRLAPAAEDLRRSLNNIIDCYYHYTGETRTVDVHVQRLRGKIGNNRIETLVKFGYRFREDV